MEAEVRDGTAIRLGVSTPFYPQFTHNVLHGLPAAPVHEQVRPECL